MLTGSVAAQVEQTRLSRLALFSANSKTFLQGSEPSKLSVSEGLVRTIVLLCGATVSYTEHDTVLLSVSLKLIAMHQLELLSIVIKFRCVEGVPVDKERLRRLVVLNNRRNSLQVAGIAYKFSAVEVQEHLLRQPRPSDSFVAFLRPVNLRLRTQSIRYGRP